MKQPPPRKCSGGLRGRRNRGSLQEDAARSAGPASIHRARGTTAGRDWHATPAVGSRLPISKWGAGFAYRSASSQPTIIDGAIDEHRSRSQPNLSPRSTWERRAKVLRRLRAPDPDPRRVLELARGLGLQVVDKTSAVDLRLVPRRRAAPCPAQPVNMMAAPKGRSRRRTFK